MSTRIRLRRADYDNWTADNPTLDYGEVGLVFDTMTVGGKTTLVGFKVGDGTTTFNNLVMHRTPVATATVQGLGSTGAGEEGEGTAVTTWEHIALLAKAQTFSAVQTFSSQIISTHSADANAIQVNTDKFTVKGNDGDTVIAGTLAVTGATTLTGAIAADGGITVDTNKFTVAGDNTGNTLIAGTLNVDGAADFDAAANFDGAVTCTSTLGVTGALTAATLAAATWQAVVSKLTADGGVVSNQGSDTHYGDQTGSDIAIGGIRSFGHRDWLNARSDITLENVGLHDAANGTAFLCFVWMFVRSGGEAVSGPDATIVKIHTVVDGNDEDEVVTTRSEMKHGSPNWDDGGGNTTGVMGFVLRLI